jgi:uncharacterized Zn finger protein
MAEPDDLLGKADALMARHHSGRAPATAYAEIPVLDEVVNFLAASGDLPLLTEYVASEPPDEAQIKALAASIRASLLARLQPEIDALIEQRLKDGLAPLVEKMYADLRGDLQRIAREKLGVAIDAALEQELERRKSDA